MKLPKMIDKDAITADFDNGVLQIVMPKLVEEKTKRRIVINQAIPPADSNAETGESGQTDGTNVN